MIRKGNPNVASELSSARRGQFTQPFNNNFALGSIVKLQSGGHGMSQCVNAKTGDEQRSRRKTLQLHADVCQLLLFYLLLLLPDRPEEGAPALDELALLRRHPRGHAEELPLRGQVAQLRMGRRRRRRRRRGGGGRRRVRCVRAWQHRGSRTLPGGILDAVMRSIQPTKRTACIDLKITQT